MTLKAVPKGFEDVVRAGRYPKDWPEAKLAGKHIQFRMVIETADKRHAEACLVRLLAMRDALVASGKGPEAKVLMRAAAKHASDPERFDASLAVAGMLEQAPPPVASGPRYLTWADLAEAYCDGTLRRDHPSADLPDKASADKDEQRRKWLVDHIGKVPLETFCRADYDHALKTLPATAVEPATRRQYGQLVLRVMRVGRELGYVKAWHLDGVEAPKVPKTAKKRFTCIYPKEWYRLLACAAVPFERRWLWGFMCKESPRIGRLVDAKWRHFEQTENGWCISMESKNGEVLEWDLAPGTIEVIHEMRRRYPDLEGPFAWMTPSFINKAAKFLRDDMATAGNDREAVHKNDGRRKRLRGHDCRATMIVNSLREGRNEKWIMMRTGHKTSGQIHTYDRLLERAQNIGWQPLGRLDVALGLTAPEADGPNPHPGASRVGGASEPVTEAATAAETGGCDTGCDKPESLARHGRRRRAASSLNHAGSPSRGRTGTPKGRGILSAAIADATSGNAEQQGGCDAPEAPGNDRTSHGGVTPRERLAATLKATILATLEVDPLADIADLRRRYEEATRGAPVVELTVHKGGRS